MMPSVNVTRLFAVWLAALSLAGIGSAAALDYPTRPVRWIVPYTPGGGTDITARIVAQWLSERLGQQFFIENKPGAGNNIGTEAMVHSPADGYTLLLVNPANAINATLYPKLPFNFLRDTAPVAGIMRVPNVMEVNPAVPAKTVAEFITYAKANPGKINWATSGNGTSVHLSGELFKLMTGVQLTHIPYKGSAPALTDLIAGTVQVIFDNMPPSLPHIRAGTLRALAVTTATRSEALPEVPTVAETVPGYEASAFYGVRAEGNSAGNRRQAQQGGERRARRCEHQSALGGARRHSHSGQSRGFWETRRRRNREVGQSDQSRRRGVGIAYSGEVASARAANSVLPSPLRGGSARSAGGVVR